MVKLSAIWCKSLDTVATWWQEVSTLSSLPKNHPVLKVMQAKNTNILLPNVEKSLDSVFWRRHIWMAE